MIPYVIGTTLIMLVQFAQSAWMLTFFVRQWGLEPHQAGQTLGPIFIVCAIAGAIVTGVLAQGDDGQQVSNYAGRGDTNDAASFTCVKP